MSSALYPCSPSTALVSSPISCGGCSIDGPPCANLNAASGTAIGPSMPASVKFVEHTARLEMRISQRFRHRPHACGRHVARLEIDLPLVGGLALDDVRDDRRLAFTVIDPRLVVGLDHVGALDRTPKPCLLADVAGADHYHALFGVVGAVSGERLLVAVR